MKEAFEELLDMARKNWERSPWIKTQTTKVYSQEVLSEVNELIQAIENKDSKNIQEELGDLLWDILMLIIIAEEERKINAREVIKGVADKMKKRKPHIIDGRAITLEEEKKIWHEAKAKEKQDKL